MSEAGALAERRFLIFERRCSRCRKVGHDFAPTAYRCRPCLREANAERYSAQRKAVVAFREQAAQQALTKAAVAFSGSAEDSLRQAMALYMLDKGFAALEQTLVDLRHDLARAARTQLERQGWII